MKWLLSSKGVHFRSIPILILISLSLMPRPGALLAQAQGESIQDSATIEVESGLLAQLDLDETTGYLIFFRERPDLSAAYEMDWHERGWFVMNALQQTAARTQARVRAHLDTQGASYQAFWIDNVIVVESSNRTAFDGLLRYSEIAALRGRRVMQVIDPVQRNETGSTAPLAIEPNLSHVQVDQAWSLGYHGEGMVVANIDTGVRYTHEALDPHYRGNLGGGSYDHDYNWLGAASGSSTPADDHGHGSHTMGTMVGDDGGTNQIGMAPGAQWIACDGCQSTGCPDTPLLTCAQWIAAPYPTGDPGSANPDMRPHVVNNSWGDCGQSYDSWYQGSVDSWHAVGIYPVFSNGNASNCGYSQPPGCNTVGNPARYGNVTGVGSTGQQDGQYASHSNWGPTDNSDTLNPRGFPGIKPQVVAPGVNIRSSLNGSDSDYASWGGTSMSAPHVSGLIALMWQACPDLVGDYATTETILETTATPISYNSGCGGEGAGNIPNNATGWGEINALAAVNEALNQCTPDFAITATPDPLDICIPDDAIYNVTIDQQNGFSTPVILSTSGRPGDTTESFVPNPVTPPGSSVLTIGNTVSATTGGYSIDVIGTAGALVHNDTVTLNLYDAAPGAAALTDPADGLTAQSTTPSFAWDPVAGAATYDIDVATDPGFATIVDLATGLTSPAYTPGSALAYDTVHYWRVRTVNPCGNEYSTTFAFRTAPPPACNDPILNGDMEAGSNGQWIESYPKNFPRSAIIGEWGIPHGGTFYAWMGDYGRADDSIRQTVDIPSGAAGSLTYWYRITSSDACNYDFAGVEINGTDVANYDLCSATSMGAYAQDSVDMSSYAGTSPEIRFWATTDNRLHSTFRIDDVEMEMCTAVAPQTADYSDLDSSYGIAWHSGDGTVRIGSNWDADTSFDLDQDNATDDLGPSSLSNFGAGQQAILHVPIQAPAGSYWLRVWFDWNDDGLFGDAGDGEQVYNSGVTGGDKYISIDVPADLDTVVNFRVRLYDSAGEPIGILAQDTGSFGGASGGEVEDGTSPIPTAVKLARFEATAAEDGRAIHLEWETTTEINNLGFNLYRAGSAIGPRTRLNEALIPGAAPGTPTGATYTWRDESVVPGITYYYWLQDVNIYGATTVHGPVWAATPGSPEHRVFLPQIMRWWR